MSRPHYDVVISGCGPCGATLANLLGMRGVSTLIIDKEDEVLNIPRAVGMCDEGSRILNSAEILEYAPVDFVDITRTNFANSKRETVFHFDMEKKINGLSMQRTFYQPELESSIRKSFERFNCVHFSPSTELTSFEDSDDEVIVELTQNGEKKTVHSRYLIACDGASSPIRKQLGIGFSGKTYRQDWLIIDIGKNPVESDQIFFSIDPNRPGITLPLPHNKRRWEFVVKENDSVENLFSEETLSKLLSHWGNFEEMELERKAIYTFHARVAAQYTKGNVFLAGDAAHITPPFAGQGMMAGLRDAQNLSWKLAGVINKELHQSVLQSYDAERIKHSRQIIKFAEIIGNIVLPQSRIKAWVRDSFIKLLTLIGFYTEDTGLNMDKIPNHINGGLLRNIWISKTRGTGVWFPQQLLSKDGKSMPSDNWINSSFYVVSWRKDGADTLSADTLRRWSDLGGKFACISDSNGNNQFFDVESEYSKLFRKKDTVVIRPDKMIALKCNARDLDKLLNRYLDTICYGTEEKSTNEQQRRAH